jgi:hypothetical protein
MLKPGFVPSCSRFEIVFCARSQQGEKLTCRGSPALFLVIGKQMRQISSAELLQSQFSFDFVHDWVLTEFADRTEEFATI